MGVIQKAGRVFQSVAYAFGWARLILAFAFVGALWVPAALFAWWGSSQGALLAVVGGLAWVLFLRMFVPPVYSIGIGAIAEGWKYLVNHHK